MRSSDSDAAVLYPTRLRVTLGVTKWPTSGEGGRLAIIRVGLNDLNLSFFLYHHFLSFNLSLGSLHPSLCLGIGHIRVTLKLTCKHSEQMTEATAIHQPED